MSSNATSFRLPSALTIPEHIEHKGEKIPLPHQLHSNIRILLNGLLDAHQAIASLNTSLNTLQATVAAIPGATTAASVQSPGGVNDQTGVASYILQQGDYGAAVVVNNGALAVPVTLNSGVQSNFYTKIVNNGSAAATLAPDSNFAGAQVISATAPTGAPSLSLGAGQTISLYFNASTKNWYAY